MDATPAISCATLHLEALRLDSVNCSYNGLSGIFHGESIYYLDKYFGYFYTFDTQGRLLGRQMGVGRGPKETAVRGIAGLAISQEDELVLFGSNADFEIFDSTLVVKERFIVPFDPSVSGEDRFETYSYAWEHLVCRAYGHTLYIGMNSECPTFNILDRPEAFLEGGYHIGRIDLRKKSPMPMWLRGFPRPYHEMPDRYASAQYVDFDFDRNGRCYVGFEADSLIYVYDDKLKPLKAFGRAGRSMDWEYRPVHSWQQMDAYSANRKDKGRYGWVEYIDRTGYLFRSYCKGAGSPFDGLQIYLDGVLVGDVDVPRGLEVAGYIPPYYYSRVVEDEQAEKLMVYRFKL